MTRYLGIMHKLKSQLSVKIRIEIYHSFVQSHKNFCSHVWVFCAKSNIESQLLYAQKKCISTLVPRFVNYKYRLDGTLPGHTKESQLLWTLKTFFFLKNILKFVFQISPFYTLKNVFKTIKFSKKFRLL